MILNNYSRINITSGRNKLVDSILIKRLKLKPPAKSWQNHLSLNSYIEEVTTAILRLAQDESSELSHEKIAGISKIRDSSYSKCPVLF